MLSTYISHFFPFLPYFFALSVPRLEVRPEIHLVDLVGIQDNYLFEFEGDELVVAPSRCTSWKDRVVFPIRYQPAIVEVSSPKKKKKPQERVDLKKFLVSQILHLDQRHREYHAEVEALKRSEHPP